MENWKDKILSKGRQYSIDPNGIVLSPISNTDSYLFHKNHTKGAYLRKLQDTQFHQIYWETPYYKKVLDQFLADYEFQDKVILDFGCGDGRFTQYLLKNGATKIVCVDFDYGTLASLSHYAAENNLNDKLLIIHSDFDNLFFEANEFDLILAIGVLYYLNDKYEASLQYFSTLMKTGGSLVTSDPDLEGSFLRMLMYESLNEAIQTFKSRRFKETKDDTVYRFRIFDEPEMLGIFSRANLKVVDRHRISLFHNLIRVLQLKGIIKEEELRANEKDVWQLFDYMHDHGTLSKHLMWHLHKSDVNK